ncbi:hypothetical protein DPMN_034805 [Dreissena polymorpha]|uniref:Uncharacterized protein n=1 Tax=Dreissena polymorpha TaxID=45954 RepID=A0A9D4M7H8_DREPO|nr:hypothetical protein DPMN_034805 [Dreissena polymorpha]
MTTVRQYDGDNAIVRWRQCDETMAKVRFDYRIVAIVLSHCRHRIVARRIVVIVLSRSRNRTMTLLPAYCRTVGIVLSHCRHGTIAFWHSRPLDFNVKPRWILRYSVQR